MQRNLLDANKIVAAGSFGWDGEGHRGISCYTNQRQHGERLKQYSFADMDCAPFDGHTRALVPYPVGASSNILNHAVPLASQLAAVLPFGTIPRYASNGPG